MAPLGYKAPWPCNWHPDSRIEATARCGAELGYQVTLVRDATAAFSFEAMHAAHEINGPTFAHAILTTEAVIAALVKA
jgi:nicotinamidase-related amidase